MEQQRIQDLVEKFIENRATPLEEAELMAWYRSSNEAELEWLDTAEATRLRMLAQITRQTRPVKVRRLWPRIAAAASVLFVLGFGTYFILHKKSSDQLAKNDVAPFSKKAILKTGHGKTLTLDSTTKGTLAQYANTRIRQNNGQQIAYTNNTEADEKVIFDTLQVPAGGKPYRLKLSDGSQVIVNVASSLRFPENFRKNNNEVALLSGEAYFSIVHNTKAPLTIKAKDQLIEDVGTEFNINTYSDEPDSRTTLVEGAIRVNAKALRPGEQAIVSGQLLVVAKANIMQVTAWKDGYFRFNGEHIQTVMRELARCYNIEVVYDGKPTDVGFYLRISRSRNISEVLKGLERITKTVHFKVEGRRVTVLGKK